MPDAVENLGDSAPAQTEATPSTNGAEPGGRKGPRNGFESRIAELVKEKHEISRTWQGKYDELLSSNEATQRELAEIKAMLGTRGNQPSKSPVFSGFQQMSDDDIDGVLVQGPQDNPAYYASILKESQRRVKEQTLAEASKQQSEQNKLQMRQMSEWNKIRQKYPDVDKDGPMRDRANEYMVQLQREYGPEIRLDMNAQWRCAQAADHDLHAQDAEELQTQRREVERLKQVQAMGTGVKSAMRLNDRVEEALKRAGQTSNASEHRAAIKSALKNLEIVQGTREP